MRDVQRGAAVIARFDYASSHDNGVMTELQIGPNYGGGSPAALHCSEFMSKSASDSVCPFDAVVRKPNIGFRIPREK